MCGLATHSTRFAKRLRRRSTGRSSLRARYRRRTYEARRRQGTVRSASSEDDAGIPTEPRRVVLEDAAVLDLDYSEDVAVEVDMNVVMTGKGGLVEVQGTAEGEPFDRPLLDGMLDLAASGIEQLIAKQRAVLSE